MHLRDMKTVLMLDRSAKFIKLTDTPVEFTLKEGTKQKKLQVEKTIWTCCLEGIFEIHRILSDIYPQGNLQLRFAVADCMGKMMDSEWTGKFIKREDLVKMIEVVKRPSESGTDVSPIGGLTLAIEALAIETPEQKEFNYDAKYNTKKRTPQNSEVTRFKKNLKSKKEKPIPLIENSGNLIVYTRLNTEEEMDKLKEDVAKLLSSRNKIANSPSNRTFCTITSLRLFIVNYYVSEDKCTVKTHPLEVYPGLPELHIWVISRPATDMPTAIHSLLMAAFDLNSTTVTKIPMKEDNRGSSNYDVELFHPASVHRFLREAKLIDTVSKNANNDEGVTYDTMRLAWTTLPKKKWSLFPHHRNAVPCTTVQAYSRPSACLTHFVRDGRCVMLDLEHVSHLGKNIPNKLISHQLVANRGRIFIQEVDFIHRKKSRVNNLKPARNLRAPNERINMNQLKHTFKQMEIKTIAKNRLDDELTEKDEEKWDALAHADIDERFRTISRNIPLYAKDTFIFHEPVLKLLEPLITTMTKQKLTNKEVNEMQNAILRLLQMRGQREPIISPNTDIGPCSVNDLSDAAEQMRVALVELARHMMKYVKYSENHQKIYKTFMTTMGVDQLLNIDADDADAADKKLVTFPFFEREKAPEKNKKGLKWFIQQKKQRSAEFMEKKIEESGGYTRKRPAVEKPIVMPKLVKIDIFANICEKIERKESRIRREFVGRETHGLKAPLYPQLAEQANRPASPVSTERAERIRNTDRGGSGTPPRRAFN